MPVFVALKVTPDPLKTGEVKDQPVETLSPAISLRLTDSLNVKETFTWLVMFASLVSELDVIEGFEVLMDTDKAEDAKEVCEFRF
jgi:hypothetical protein